MPTRFGSTLVDRKRAVAWKYEEHVAGSDHANLAGNCESPIMRPMVGMRDSVLHQQKALWEHLRAEPWLDYHVGHGFRDDSYGWTSRPLHDQKPVHVDIAVRCRKCRTCLKARSVHWRMRAVSELAAASRSWFGTLTLSPDSQFRMLSKCRLRLAAQRLDFDELGMDDQYRERVREISKEVTKYLKRVRKQSSASFRYMIVAEKHKNGLPHFHLLLHEGVSPVRHKVLVEQWNLGFSKFNLVEGKHPAFYVAKYLAKSAEARVRASVGYGAAVQKVDIGGLSGTLVPARRTF